MRTDLNIESANCAFATGKIASASKGFAERGVIGQRTQKPGVEGIARAQGIHRLPMMNGGSMADRSIL